MRPVNGTRLLAGIVAGALAIVLFFQALNQFS
jgi:hypothetical protein